MSSSYSNNDNDTSTSTAVVEHVKDRRDAFYPLWLLYSPRHINIPPLSIYDDLDFIPHSWQWAPRSIRFPDSFPRDGDNSQDPDARAFHALTGINHRA